jgi:DNA polymerase III subunit gamma/tau
MTQALARQYRPKDFDEIVGQTHVVQALRNTLDRQHLHHAYLFTGTRGIGKTTIARIIAKCLNCETGITSKPCQQCHTCQEIDGGRFPDLFEVDAASRTKVEDTRELLDNVQYATTKGRYKVYLIDEVHMLSGHSFNALLKTLEEPPEHVIFLLATTDHQKLPATVLSRCLQFHLQPMAPEVIDAQLQNILKQEKIEFDDTATRLLSKAANGSMRDSLSLLDQAIAHGNGEVRDDAVKQMLGTIEITAIRDILSALYNQQADALLDATEALSKQTTDFTQALSDLLNALHELAILQAVPDAQRDVLDADTSTFSQKFSAEDIQLYYQIALMGQRDLPYAPSARCGFEMTLLRMLAFTPNTDAGDRPVNQPQKQTAKPTTAAAKAAAPLSATTSSWSELLNQLEINGATMALAQQCQQKKITESELHLILDPKQKPFLQDKHIERIQAALTQHFARPMLVSIELNQTNGETPAELVKRKDADRQSAAENAIMTDQKVQNIMKTFDATVIKDSIAGRED